MGYLCPSLASSKCKAARLWRDYRLGPRTLIGPGGVKVGHSDAGRPVSVIYYDDASKTDQAGHTTERLITSDHVDLLFGPYSGVLALAAAQVAEAHGRLLWNQGGAADII